MEKDIFIKINESDENWLNDESLFEIIKEGLSTFSPGIYPVKTRKKLFKNKICEILGYEIPKSFQRKVKPMFPMLNFDLYIQESHNLQIWNEKIDTDRRYVIVKIDNMGNLINLKVIRGIDLSIYDTTGKLTTKLQAKLMIRDIKTILYSEIDTENLSKLIKSNSLDNSRLPCDEPEQDKILSIKEIFEKLKVITTGEYNFINTQTDRERGDIVHKICSKLLGYLNDKDNGQFPDIRNQLLEIKLQTSPTIDIGLEYPSSIRINRKLSTSFDLKNEDVRYAIIYAEIKDNIVNIKNLVLVNGRNFFEVFPQMQGNVINGKIQLPLPKSFFD